jgi:hypothetical protein
VRKARARKGKRAHTTLLSEHLACARTVMSKLCCLRVVGELRSRNTYYEIKVTSEEWWTLLFTAWVGISLFLITRAVLYNVKHGWHCPRNCDAFMTPFAVAIGTCVLPIFFCCPVLGAKGVWWVYIRRKKDDDAHRNHVRRQKKMCCIAISWIPTAQSKLFCFTRSRDTSKPLPDAAAYGDVQAPSWVTEGTEHAMVRAPPKFPLSHCLPHELACAAAFLSVRLMYVLLRRRIPTLETRCWPTWSAPRNRQRGTWPATSARHSPVP